MRVHNVHERIVEVPAEAVAPLLERIGQPDDVLWPSPQWPPMVLDGPLRVGAAGGHGPVRYHVSSYEPGRRIEFTFDGEGLDGSHALSVEPLGPSRTLLRHVVEGEAGGQQALRWLTAVRFGHDAVVEALLDRAEIALGTGPERAARPSPVARVLGWGLRPRAYDTAVPETELLAAAMPRPAWSDAYAVDLRPGMPEDARDWLAAMFRHPPLWVVPALGLRQVLALLCGIRPGSGQARATDREVLVEVDTGSFECRVALLREPDRVVVCTAGTPHDARGQLFLDLAGRVHPFVVRAVLTRVAGVLARRAEPRRPVAVSR